MRKIIAAVCLLLAAFAPADAGTLYSTTATNFASIQVLSYAYVVPPLGSCGIAWQVMTMVVPDVRAGDLLDARAQLMLSARESGDQAAVGWVLHIEPWTGTVPLNRDLPCMSEPWVGEDIGPARPYLVAQASRVWRAEANYPNGVLVMLRLYAQSAAPRGYLQIAPTSPSLTVMVH